MLLLIGTAGLHAQETVTVSGGDATGSNGSSSYTVGQVVYTAFTGSTGSVAQGVQQPYEISITSGVEITEIDLVIATYPNPSHHSINIMIGDFNYKKLIYQLYDLNGELLNSEQIINSSTTINISNLPPSIYLLNVLDDHSLLKTFRIVKN